MVSSSLASAEGPPSPEYTLSAEYAHVDGDTVVDDYVYRGKWVALCSLLHGKMVSQLRDIEDEALLNRELLSCPDRHLVDSISACRSLDRREVPRVERALHRDGPDYADSPASFGQRGCYR
ncbi:hypothetical protein LIER_38671 [Lithospermum erythrorhizon]|uniref:Uncharacterized protein n=1 Tax=Lithospermum erythrorhizon TaxID=34254 RepID=A0AAV3Q6F7_LITER